MASQTIKQLVELIQKSRLVSKTILKEQLALLKEANGGKYPSRGKRLADQLIAAGELTEWQYEKLETGRYKGFFLGKYRLLSLLGSGGMSSVYLADHKLMNRQVAVKVLPRSRVDDKSYLERFYLEAQAVAALDHPNIVRAYDVDCEGDTHYLVMEYVRGKDLQTFVRDSARPLNFGVAAEFISQAARGLQHAHDANLIHRDVKPANLLVEESGNVKLLDLGLALAKDDDGSVTEDHDEKVLGTADYLAPEQAINSHNVDGRVDIYSLGCTLYFSLVGKPPFSEGSLAQRIAAHQNVEPDGVRVLRPDCPEALAEICHRMMQKSPGDRFQTAEEVAKALDAWRKSAKVAVPIPDVMPVIVTGGDSKSGSDVESSNGPAAKINLNVQEGPQTLAARRTRKRVSTAKRPPIGLWVGLGLLSIVAIGLLAYFVVTQN